MKTIYFFILLFTIASFTGCPKSTPVKPEVVERVANYEIQQLEDNLFGYECAYFGKVLDITETSTGRSSKTTRTRACAQGTTVDKDKAQRIRNATAYRLIRVIDYNYFEFEQELYQKRSTGSFLADALDIGGNLAGAITNGERAKTIINAALVAFRGTRKSASIHYFQEQTADILITKMQTARNRVLADIIDELENKNVDEYSLDAALGDIISYFYAGTLPRALQELREDANIEAKKAKNNVRIVKGLTEPGVVTKQRRATSREAFEVLRDLESALTVDEEAENALEKLRDILKELEKDEALKKDLQGQEVSSKTDDGQKIINALREIKEMKSDLNDDASIEKINDAIVKFGKITEEDE